MEILNYLLKKRVYVSSFHIRNQVYNQMKIFFTKTIIIDKSQIIANMNYRK